MPKTGIKLAQDAIDAHQAVNDKKSKFCIFKFDNPEDIKFIVLQYKSESMDDTFDDLLSKISKEKAQYIFYNINYTTKTGQIREKLIFVTLCSDDHVPLKEKMLCASTKDEIKGKCKANGAANINDMDEFNEKTFIEVFKDA